MIKKTIWLVCINAQPPEIDTHLRHQKFAEMLMANGYNVIIFAGSYLHYNKQNLINGRNGYIEKKYNNKHYVFIKVPSYLSNGVKRMWAIFVFSCRLFLYRKKFPHPDLILHNLRVPFDFPVSLSASLLKAKYVTEVWDLWPESFVAFGLMKKSNPLLKLAYCIEKKLYQKADQMIFTMEGARDYIIEKKWDVAHGGKIDLSKCNYINNGVDLDEFDYNKKHYQIDDPDLKNPDLFKVVYMGSIRLVNGLKDLIGAAQFLQQEKKIKFLIYGDGSEREYLERYCKERDIANVCFKEKWLEIKYIPYILSCSSLNIFNYKKNDIDRFGGSQGKLFQYMASGKPICSNQVMGYDLILRYKMGIAQEFKSSQEYADAIKKIYNLPVNEYNNLCLATRTAAQEFDFKVLYAKFQCVLERALCGIASS